MPGRTPVTMFCAVSASEHGVDHDVEEESWNAKSPPASQSDEDAERQQREERVERFSAGGLFLAVLRPREDPTVGPCASMQRSISP